jgi:hypothetical protein
MTKVTQFETIDEEHMRVLAPEDNKERKEDNG